jgi:hypothetical protein
MLLFDGVLGLMFLGLWIFCIIDVITTPESDARNLPKFAWLFIVILLSDIGSIAWLVAGRNWDGKGAVRAVRPASPRSTTRASNPDDDEEFLSSLRARADEQRRRAREAQQAEDKPDDDS